MPLLPLVGHATLRRRLRERAAHDALPASLLIHGPRGIGKQQLALWLARLLLCGAHGERPCGDCASCRAAARLEHPDLHWVFPRPRLGDGDASPDDVLGDLRAAAAERLSAGGMYAAPAGTEAIYVATVRALLREAGRTPAMSARKVFVLGDAERMVPQEGADAAANAFLKLLEEPPTDTVLVLTTGEPGALLPTIRSRVAALRATPLRDAEVRELLADVRVAQALDASGAPASLDERVRLAAGAPGRLFAASQTGDALASARMLLSAAERGRADRMRTIAGLGSGSARGFFREVLDALTVLLHERARGAAAADRKRALAAARAMHAVEEAKHRAAGNVNPQLAAAALARELSELFA